MKTDYDLDVMIDQLNLTINEELDLTANKNKYIKSMQIKRSGKMFIVSFWHGNRFDHSAIVKKTGEIDKRSQYGETI